MSLRMSVAAMAILLWAAVAGASSAEVAANIQEEAEMTISSTQGQEVRLKVFPTLTSNGLVDLELEVAATRVHLEAFVLMNEAVGKSSPSF